MFKTQKRTPSEIAEIVKSHDHIHFIGIGGISMSALASIAHKMGFEVSGSDWTKTHITEKLKSEGIEIFIGQDAKNIHENETIVYTAAVSETNPEVQRAKELELPFIYRADFLNYIMCFSESRIGVCGMHGKSTTSAMISHILYRGKYDPTIIVGAELDEIGGTHHIGKGRECVFEADEYSDSFLSFSPTIALVLNIDIDHVDYFHSLDQIKNSFTEFIKKTENGGYTVYNADNENVLDVMSRYTGKKVSYAIDSPADFTAENIVFSNGNSSFDVIHNGKNIASVSLPIAGKHIVSDSLGAFALLYTYGVDSETIKDGLASYSSVKRRMEYKCKINGADVYEDYAHHPTEISATLLGIKPGVRGRLICAFQPHTYTRTKGLWNEFVSSLSIADTVLLCDIYAAREDDIYGVNSKMLADDIKNGIYLGSFEKTYEYICKNAKEDDVVIIMGAGDIYKVSDMLCERK